MEVTRARSSAVDWTVPLVAALGSVAALSAGVLAVQAPALAFLVPLLALAVLGLTISPCYWALAAVATTVCSRVAVELGLLPGYAAYIDQPLAWGAFILAMLTARSWTPTARRVTLGVAGLGVAVTAAGMLAGSPPVRWLFSYALLGAPFALIAAILLAPPSRIARKHMVSTALALAYIQVPIAIAQFLQATHPDEVRGTFVGSEAGAHLVGALCTLAAVWVIARARSGLQTLAAMPLLLVPILSDAKAVLFALPIVLLASPARTRLATWIRAGVVVVLFSFVVGGAALQNNYSIENIERTLGGQSGKIEALRVVSDELTSSADTFLVGLGPAETVSFSALLTLDPLRGADSPVGVLNLSPSSTLLELGASPSSASFIHPASSALGVVGDLGLVGGSIYYIVLGFLFISAWRLRTPDGAGATAALALFIVLGFVFIWWEQTGFSLYVALITGLALTGGPLSAGGRPARR